MNISETISHRPSGCFCKTWSEWLSPDGDRAAANEALPVDLLTDRDALYQRPR